MDTYTGPLPELNAKTVVSRAQKIQALVLLGVLIVSLCISRSATLQFLNLAAIAFYLVFAAYKLILQFESIHHPPAVDTRAPPAPDTTLPLYTILVPLYREDTAVRGLVEHLGRLQYPADRLQVLLLVEADDAVTRRAVAALDIRPPFRVVEIPPSLPRTKPKACNIGLEQATGEYLVVFDAEDRPEPDQLLKAVHGFRTHPRTVICLQARLNYYNRDRNPLTRLFTAEYSTWFDYCLPGLSALDAPIPLGGTSNHFRLDVLRTLKGWDPYNVTEDCDLGIRLYSSGYRTELLDSTTWEEATFRLGPWIRQRSRWIKGYIQTYLVHLRRHDRLRRQMGNARTLHFHFLFGATAFALVMNPVYWILTLIWLTTRAGWIDELFPVWITLPAMLSFLAGNAAFIFSSMLGCLQRRYYHLIPWCLLMPVYWVFMSVGAWKGMLQLITRPFFWEKTPHEATTSLPEVP